MSTLDVCVKHKGKSYDVEVDLESNGETFKYQVYSLTGVEPDRQKILLKGKQLKDDDDMSKMGLKPKQAIMMMGTPSGAGIPSRPTDIKFVEDLTEAEAAQQAGATPAGLTNLGNTCYLNSTLQTLRSIPELQESLVDYRFQRPATSSLSFSDPSATSEGLDLVSQLKHTYKDMSETQSGYSPLAFITALRTRFPQFAEMSRSGHGYAQQDAEEVWSQIITQLQQQLKVKNAEGKEEPWVNRYMAGEFESTLECDEQAAKDAGEEAKETTEPFLKLSCHIDMNVNHLTDGLRAGMSEKIEKRSEILGRDAIYNKQSKISKLPKYLAVHFVRFFWKKEIRKKAKIMRKVTFPHELDLVEFCTDSLKKSLAPVRDKVREIRKEEEDIERSRKRRKLNPLLDGEPAGSDSKKDKKKEEEKAAAEKEGDVVMGEGETFKTDAEIDAEKDAALLASKKELHALIDPKLAEGGGANTSGIYELRAIVTHQGAGADSGHYTAYVKKTAPIDPKTGKRGSEDGKWWWFNDDKVDEVDSEKIASLAGGGEYHSALILLYRAIPLPTAEGTME